MFLSPPRSTTYNGLLECASPGLHQHAFNRIRPLISPGATVLDLGSGKGAWAQRLYDAGYAVTACDLDGSGNAFAFPYLSVNLNEDFASRFREHEFDAVTIVEVIEHLENPRHIFRQIKQVLKRGGVLLVSTPNASGLYSRLRFFFTGQMAMFTDVAYHEHGHITPLTVWHLEKVIQEQGFSVLQRGFYDAPFFPPRASGDFAKILAWTLFRPAMFGTVGGQNLLFVLRNETGA
jgi:SAM-dependent methyltransferase